MYLFSIRDISWWNLTTCSSETVPVFPRKKKIQVGLQEMEFQQHVTPQGTVWGRWLLHDFYVDFWFVISQNLLHTFSNTSQALLSTVFNLYWKWMSSKSSFTWGPTKMSSFILASIMCGNYCLNCSNPSPSLFVVFTNIFISPNFMWRWGINLFIL